MIPHRGGGGHDTPSGGGRPILRLQPNGRCYNNRCHQPPHPHPLPHSLRRLDPFCPGLLEGLVDRAARAVLQQCQREGQREGSLGRPEPPAEHSGPDPDPVRMVSTHTRTHAQHPPSSTLIYTRTAAHTAA